MDIIPTVQIAGEPPRHQPHGPTPIPNHDDPFSIGPFSRSFLESTTQDMPIPPGQRENPFLVEDSDSPDSDDEAFEFTTRILSVTDSQHRPRFLGGHIEYLESSSFEAFVHGYVARMPKPPRAEELTNKECVICQEEYGGSLEPEYAISLPCHHVVGNICIERWFLGHPELGTCPLCRRVLFEEDYDDDEDVIVDEDDDDDDSVDDDDGDDNGEDWHGPRSNNIVAENSSPFDNREEH